MKPILHSTEPLLADLGSKGTVPRPAHSSELSVQAPEAKSLCAACRGYHGSHGQELNCLRGTVRAQRQVIALLHPYFEAVKRRNGIMRLDRKSLEGIDEEVAALRKLRESVQ